jgi:hypothetical protein
MHDAHVSAYREHRFLEVLRNGGSLVVHPDTLAGVRRAPVVPFALIPALFGIRVITNEHMEVGDMVAVPPLPPIAPPRFNFDTTYLNERLFNECLSVKRLPTISGA